MCKLAFCYKVFAYFFACVHAASSNTPYLLLTSFYKVFASVHAVSSPELSDSPPASEMPPNHYSSTYIQRATRKDIDPVFELVNECFSMEVGEDGLGFRNESKYRLRDQARKAIDDMLVMKDHTKVGLIQSIW